MTTSCKPHHVTFSLHQLHRKLNEGKTDFKIIKIKHTVSVQEGRKTERKAKIASSVLFIVSGRGIGQCSFIPAASSAGFSGSPLRYYVIQLDVLLFHFLFILTIIAYFLLLYCSAVMFSTFSRFIIMTHTFHKMLFFHKLENFCRWCAVCTYGHQIIFMRRNFNLKI